MLVLAELELFNDKRVGTAPPEPTSEEDTNLDRGLLIDLILKTLHQGGPQAGNAVARAMHLPLGAIYDILADQRRLHTIEVLGSDRTEFGDGAYIYALTEEGEQ